MRQLKMILAKVAIAYFFISDQAIALSPSQMPKSSNIDLSNWKAETSYSIQGPWDFYWSELLDENSKPKLPPKRVEEIVSWRDIPGLNLPGIGYASYTTTLLNLPDETLSIKIDAPDSASKLVAFVENNPSERYVAYSGKPAKDKLKTVPSRKPLILQLPRMKKGEKLILILQIANFHSASGGVWAKPTLGLNHQLRRDTNLNGLVNLAAIGVALAVGIYNFMIFYRRRQDQAALFLGLVSLTSMARSVTTTSLVLDILPDESYTATRIIEYLTIPLSLLTYQLFLESTFFNEKKNLLSKSLLLANTLLALFTLVTPPEVNTRYLSVYQLFFVGVPVYFFYLVIVANLRKKEGAGLVLSGFLLMLASAVFDVLVTNIGLGSIYLTPISAAIFLILQAQVIAKRSAIAYEKAERYANELVEKEAARTLFFHNTSHELRTPLNGIIGFLELIISQRYGQLNEQASSKIAKALRLAESLKVQVNTILDLAKSKRGELKKQVSHFSLEELKKEADGLAEGLCLKSSDLSYKSKIEAHTSSFYSDREKVFTIIRNLLGNAFKFRHSGKAHQVTLELYHLDGNVTIKVKDTGIGIPANKQEAIFEEFGQLQSDARRAYEGTGLGLSMVKDLTNLLGGSLSLESEENKGTCFTIVLPSLESELDHSVEPKDFQNLELSNDNFKKDGKNIIPAKNIAINQKSFDIMVIDDNETNCEVICEILESEGYRISSHISARVGIEEMMKKKPNLLLLDMMMPEMSGEDVIDIMKNDDLLKDIPVILITARASEEDRIEGLKLGVDDYLPKPIFATELRLRVHNMMYRHNLLKQVEQANHNEKFAILGNLMGELSHEIKNILHGAEAIKDLTIEDRLALCISHQLNPKDIDELVDITSSELSIQKSYDRMKELDLGQRTTPQYKHKKYIRNDLSLFASQPQTLKSFWTRLDEIDQSSLNFVVSFSRIFAQYKILENQIHKMKNVTQSVLNYTRNYESSTSDLNDCWAEVCNLLSSKIARNHIDLKSDIKYTQFTISPNVLFQILLNLTSNAVDALSQLKPEERWIKLSSFAKDGKQVIEVSNPGQAIEESLREDIFKQNFTTKGESGNGVGLYISKRYANSLGGNLIYQFSDGVNSFILTLNNNDIHIDKSA